MFREGKPAKLFWSIHSHQDAIEVAEDPEHTLVIFESLYEALLLVVGNNLNQYGTVDQKKEQAG